MADHAQCHRDIDLLLAEIARLRDMLRLCEEHCSDGFVAEKARALLAYSVERHTPKSVESLAPITPQPRMEERTDG